jgi:hypothetical protein
LVADLQHLQKNHGRRHAGVVHPLQTSGAAAITYFVPFQFVQQVWTGLLLIVSIGGLVVLGYSLLASSRATQRHRFSD